MKKILIILGVLLNSCIGPIEVEYEKIHNTTETFSKPPTPIPTQTILPTPTFTPTNTERPRRGKLKCSVPFTTHTGCTKCPLEENVDPNPEDVKRYLKFGTGRGHTLFTPSKYHKGRLTLLLTDTFGKAQKVWMCANKGCVEMQLSYSFGKPKSEAGFANDCRQHWRYNGNPESQIGNKNNYFKVRKNNKDYTFPAKNFRDRQE